MHTPKSFDTKLATHAAVATAHPGVVVVPDVEPPSWVHYDRVNRCARPWVAPSLSCACTHAWVWHVSLPSKALHAKQPALGLVPSLRHPARRKVSPP
eukprot:5692000-Amphidinium_carterae.1